MVRRLTSLIASALVIVSPLASSADTPARPAPSPSTSGPEQALDQRIAVWRFDALGIEPELVTRLETLFRMELDRLARRPLPSRRDIERVVSTEQQQCTGEEKCLGAIGKKLGVDIVVTGTVGAMGPNYVLNIKAVDTASSKLVRRIQSEPLRGSPDELIEGVRVAAYKLLAPAQLLGSIQVQTDLVGAVVQLDGAALGKTPLPNLGVIGKQTLGKHKLRVQAAGYAPFEEEVEVRFQKASQVIVRLIPSTEVVGTGRVQQVERQPFYTKTWFLIGVGVAAVVIGASIGHAMGQVECTSFDEHGNRSGC
ncbi:MAG: PEGA domain-containing protein [Deltaproteobacteria bacterium]|nr:PEGA domain-containing protein [Deltaproteobacteria bacterium]